MFEIENGFAFKNYTVQGKAFDSNTLLVNDRFRLTDHDAIASFDRIALVRDPVRRLLSAYSNRVQYYRELSVEAVGAKLEELCLQADPGIDVFMRNISAYMQCSKSIARHFALQERFVGRDKSYFARVFKIEQLDEFVDYMNATYSANATFPHYQDGGAKIEFDSLAGPTKLAIINYVETSAIFDWVPEYREKYNEMLTLH